MRGWEKFLRWGPWLLAPLVGCSGSPASGPSNGAGCSGQKKKSVESAPQGSAPAPPKKSSWAPVELLKKAELLHPAEDLPEGWVGSFGNVPFVLHDVDCEKTTCVAAGNKGILASNDEGKSWVQWEVPRRMLGARVIDERLAYVVGEEGAVLRTKDAGAHWEAPRFAPRAHFSTVWGRSEKRVVFAGDGEIWGTQDGADWAREQERAGVWFYGSWGPSDEEIYVAGSRESAGLLRWENSKWTDLRVPGPDDEFDTIKFLVGTLDGVLLAATTYSVYRREETGGPWVNTGAPGSGEILGMWVTGRDEVIIGGRNARRALSPDSGKTWVDERDPRLYWEPGVFQSIEGGWGGVDGALLIVGEGPYEAPERGTLFRRKRLH